MKSKLLVLLLTLSALTSLVSCNIAGEVEPTADQSMINPEQAIVGALTDYLEEQGTPASEMNMQVKAIVDDYAWVEVVSNDPAEPGGSYALMKRENSRWTIVVSGSGMEIEHAKALGIPESVWQEDWLSQPSQPAVTAQPANALSEVGCSKATVESQTQSLVDEAHGFCLLYPATHTVEQLDSGNTEIVLGSVMNHTDPRASIVVQDLAGRDLEQVVEEFLAGYQGFDIKRTQLTVGGEAAILLDRIPGQDFYRKVMVARDGSLYLLSFSPYDPDLVDSFAQAEQIYKIVIDSFRFLSRSQEPAAVSTSESGPPICPDLPRPAMVFQAANGEDYILRHTASGAECTMQFDLPLSRLLLLAADGIYFSTSVISESSRNKEVIHYGNDGTLTELPFLEGDKIRFLVSSLDGSRVAWTQQRMAKTTGGEDMVVSELYSAKEDGSDIRLIQSVDNAAEVKRGEPYIAWTVQPVRFLEDSELLFTIGPEGSGGSWNAYTGRYSNLFRNSLSTGENNLIYECPAADYASFCIGAISADSAYFAVTERDDSVITLFRMDGTPVGKYSGPGQDYIGFPAFSPAGDFVYMTADVAEDQITIEQSFMSFVSKPYETAAITLLTEPLSYIWDWVDEQHILYTAVEDGQTTMFSPSLVKLDGGAERLPKTYGLFLGVLP